MTRHRTLFMTERGRFHQQFALDAAPPALDVVMLRQPDPAELAAQLAEAEFIISERAGVIDAAMIAAAPHLRMIVRVGSLAHDIDLDAARGQGVIVSLWPQPGVIFVAEHIILQMQALVKRLREAEAKALGAGSDTWAASRRTDEDTFAYNWTQMLDVGGLFEKTVGILGFGEIGAEVARHLQGWGCRVLYNRRRRLPEVLEAELGIIYAAQDEVLAESDFVANLLPYYPETDMVLGAEAFARMKRGACLVSCGSGSVIDRSSRWLRQCAAGHLARRGAGHVRVGAGETGQPPALDGRGRCGGQRALTRLPMAHRLGMPFQSMAVRGTTNRCCASWRASRPDRLA